MIIKSQFSVRSEFYFACLEAKVNGWNLQISDKKTTHLSENTKGGIESGYHDHQYHYRRRRSRRRRQEHLEGGRPSLLHLLYSPNSENPIFHPPHHHHNYNDMTCGVLLFLTVRTRLE